MLSRLANSLGATLLFGAALVVAPALASAASSAAVGANPGANPDANQNRAESDGLHRGQGWYDAKLQIPEPPLALALVIIGAAAMRLRDRRQRRTWGG